jgi:hypothetical protein
MTIDKRDVLTMSYKDPVDNSLKVLTGRPMPDPRTASAEIKKPAEK